MCAFKQALNSARIVSQDAALHRKLMERVARCEACFNLDQTPAALSQPVYTFLAELSGVPDPYSRQKAETNRAALDLLPELRERMRSSPDPLDVALHAAVAGNIIDLGIGHAFDLERDLRQILDTPFAIDAADRFRRELRPGRRILYLGDNAGEIVFDRLFVEYLLGQEMSVTYTVKSGPVINDATMEDARVAGLTDLVRVIETGSDDIGINWNRVSGEFMKAFEAADMVIAKGHGNYETCEDRPGNFYFLLKAKCDVVARQLGVRLGDIVFKSAG